jgi:hypothetical protein
VQLCKCAAVDNFGYTFGCGASSGGNEVDGVTAAVSRWSSVYKHVAAVLMTVMTPPYLVISFTPLLLTSDTRKRPPRSGCVQTAFSDKLIGARTRAPVMNNHQRSCREPICRRGSIVLRNSRTVGGSVQLPTRRAETYTSGYTSRGTVSFNLFTIS